MAIHLYDNESGRRLGEIDQRHLQFLIDQLEEETSTDQDYYLNPQTLDMLETAGADAQLIQLLRDAMAGREGVEIRWSREP